MVLDCVTFSPTRSFSASTGSSALSISLATLSDVSGVDRFGGRPLFDEERADVRQEFRARPSGLLGGGTTSS